MQPTISTDKKFVNPILQYDPETKLFRLMSDYYFCWGEGDNRKRIFIPAGFEYDKASVPKYLWGLARPDGPAEAAALPHDYTWLYRGKMPEGFFQVLIEGKWVNDPSPWTMRQTNNLFEKMLILGGFSPVKAKTYRLAVELFPPNWFKGF